MDENKEIKPAAKKKKKPQTTSEKLKKAWKILKRRMNHKYHKYKVKQIRRKKQHQQLKKKLSLKEYYEYRIYELINGDWKRLVVQLILLLLLIFLLSVTVKGVRSLIHHISESFATVETEVETESETETEKLFPVKDITVGTTGCMLLHSPFIDHYGDYSGNYDFESVYKFITPYYSKPDYMTCEFEGSLGGPDMGYSGYPMFISPDIIIQNIKNSGVDLQFLATNHIYDGGSQGFRRTMEVYGNDKINYTGIRPDKNADPFYIADINGIKVGFINYVYETDGIGKNINGIPIDDADADLLNSFNYNNIAPFYSEMEKNIAAMKKKGAQFIIAQMHWGLEYNLYEDINQDQIAQKLCNLGVDAIIGGHPHCEQPIDVVASNDGSNRRMFVVYSEGNALSNQRKELMDEMPDGYTEDGAMITLTLHQDKHGEVTLSNIELLPTWVYRYFDTEGKTRYYILPLDNVDNIETLTGIHGIIEPAKASYERTMEVLKPGLERALSTFYKEPEPETEAETETETETETEAKKRFGFF